MQQSEWTKKLMMKPTSLAQELDRFDQSKSVAADMNDDEHALGSEEPTSKRMQTSESEAFLGESLHALKCSCHERPCVTAWGSLYNAFGLGTVSVARHRRNCPWSVYRRGFQISMQYAFPQYFLKKAIQLSFSTIHGAGGFSLAPNLGIISVATRGNPAMEILSDTYHKETSSKELIAKFRRMFLEDRASPFDIDELGRNLIHVSDIIYTSTKHG